VILPGKHIRADRSLVVIGGEILGELTEPRTVSEVWDLVRKARAGREHRSPLSYDWFVLALSLLYAMSAVRLDGDRIVAEKAK
jgi:hypothetical protein